MGKVLMKGNEAIGEAAIRAGCLNYFAYPITPQSEVAEYLARRMPEVDGVFHVFEPGHQFNERSAQLHHVCAVPGGICEYYAGGARIGGHLAIPGRLFPGHQRGRTR